MGFLCISKHAKWEMLWYDVGTKIDGPVYLETIKKYVCRGTTKRAEDVELIWQEDNAPCHTASKIRDEKEAELKQAGLKTLVEAFGLKWPAKSPDLSPIENVWAWIDHRLKEHHITTLHGMRAFVNRLVRSKAFADVVSDMLDSFKRRLQKCVEMEGENVQNVDPADTRALPEAVEVS